MNKHTATKTITVLTAALLLVSQTVYDLPFIPAADAAHTVSAAEFAAQLAAHCSSSEDAYTELCFCPDTAQYRCGGENVGSEYQGWQVRNGAPVYNENGRILTAQEAEAVTGCTVREKDGETVISSPFQTGRLIVKSARPVHVPDCEEIASGYANLHVLQFSSAGAAYAAYQSLSEQKDIRYVCPDQIFSGDDTAFSAKDYDASDSSNVSWGVSAIGADEYCEWLEQEKNDLPEITVAVIDTGINTEHIWFQGRIAENGKCFSLNNGGTIEDEQGHGSHCAGIICQSTPKNVRILPIKVLNRNNKASTLEIYCGLMYALEQKADVVSMSIGGWGESALMDDGVRSIAEAGIPICISAGNNTEDVIYHTPAYIEDAVTVSAVDYDWWSDNGYTLASFSNYGDKIDFAAPGSGILSAVSGSPTSLEEWNGTSMATPFVAAAFADLLSYDPSLSFAEMYDLLKQHAKDLGTEGRDPEYGWGMIDLHGSFFGEQRCAKPEIRVEEQDYYPNRVYYSDPITIHLSTETEGAEIYYTLDGSTPSAENGIRYTEPFRLENSVHLKAVAVKDGTVSRMTSADYCIAEQMTDNPYVIEDGVLIGYNGLARSIDLRGDVLPGTVKAIGDNAFAGKEVRYVFLPDSVTSIGAHAFDGCNLEVLEATGVTEMGEYAIANNQLDTLTVGKLKKLSRGAFDHSGLKIYPEMPENLTEIPDNAFAGCTNLASVDLHFENITTIGKGAFEYSDLSGTVKLPKLESLGEAAFHGAKVNALYLPETLTALPDNLLCESQSLEYLSAPGITEIGEKALWIFDCTYKADIDFAKLTRIGAFGLCYQFEEPVTFSALTEMGENALFGTKAPLITMPKLTELKSYSLAASQAPVYLPNLRHLGEFDFEQNEPIWYHYGQPVMKALIVGDKLETVDPDILIEPDFFAGPAESPLRDYVEQYNQKQRRLYGNQAELKTYYVTPYLAPASASEQRILQYASAELCVTSISADFADSVEWSLLQNGTAVPIEGASGASYTFYAEQPGDYTVRAKLKGVENSTPAEFRITVLPAVQLTADDLLSDGETYVIDWKKISEACPEYQAVPASEDALIGAYIPITPETDGDWYAFSSNASSLIDPEHPAESVKLSGTENLAELKPVPLKGGKTYYILTQTYRDQSVFDYVRIADHDFSGLLCCDDSKPSYYLGEFFTKDGEIIGEPSVVLDLHIEAAGDESNSQIITLKNKEDFVTYFRPDKPDREGNIQVRYYSLCCGNYYSRKIYSSWKNASAVNGILTEKQPADCSFPEESRSSDSHIFICQYTHESDSERQCFYTAFRQDMFRQQSDLQAVIKSVQQQSTAIQIFSADGQEMRNALTFSQHSADRLICKQYSGLEKGKTYFIRLKTQNPALQLCTAPDAEKLLPVIAQEFDPDSVQFLTDGNPVEPEPQFSYNGLEIDALTRDRDYEITYFNNQTAGTVYMYLRGIGAYQGDCILTCPLAGRIQENETLLLKADAGPVYVIFTPEYSEYQFVLDLPENGKYSVYSSAYVDTVPQNRLDQEYLKAGESVWHYFSSTEDVFLKISPTDHSDLVFRIERKRSLSAAMKIEAPACMAFTGKPAEPEYQLHFTDETLTEGEDYEIRLLHNDAPGEMLICAKGIGEYTGSVYAGVVLAEPITPDSGALNMDGTTGYFLASPEPDTDYSLYLGYSEERIRAMLESGVYDAAYFEGFTEKTKSWLELFIQDDPYYPLDGIEGNASATKGLYYFPYSSKIREWGESSTGRINTYCSQPYSIYFLSKKKHLHEGSFTGVLSKDTGTGKISEKEISLYYNGKYLKRDLDYSFTLLQDESGEYHGIVCGLGDYCGTIVTVPRIELSHDSELSELALDTPTEYRPFIDETYQEFELNLERETTFILESLSGGEQISGFIGDNIGSNDLGIGVPVTMSAGRYTVRLTGTPSGKRPLVFRLSTRAVSLDNAEVFAEDCIYTGKPVMPQVSVTLDGQMLQQDTDYVLHFKSALTECGQYTVTVKGTGKYLGEAFGTFHIIPQLDPQTLPALNEGKNTAEITEAGMPAFYKWNPEYGSYCFTKDELDHTAIKVYDSEWKCISRIGGISYTYGTVQPEAGKQYYVSVSYFDKTAKGSIPFKLTSAYRLLDDCEAVLPETPVYIGTGLPEITVTDGGKRLTEGLDYRIERQCSQSHLGRAYVLLRGIGIYIGELEVAYRIAPADMFTAADPQPDTEVPETKLTLDEAVFVPHGRFGDAQRFVFTAGQDGTYYLTLPDAEKDEITVYVYAPDGSLLPELPASLTLQAGETCSIYCVANFVIDDLIDAAYTVAVSAKAPAVTVSADGVIYSADADGATVIGLTTDAAGIEIPEEIYISELGQNIPVIGIDAAGFAEFADSRTIYGKSGGKIDTFCHANGYCFAATDPAETIAGDVTGDGVVDIDDVLTFARWLSESNGMHLNDTAFAQADLNADGIADLSDLRAMLALAEHETEPAE